MSAFQAPTHPDDLARYLRELAVENLTANSTLNINSSSNQSHPIIDDFEADKFIQDLKQLSKENESTTTPPTPIQFRTNVTTDDLMNIADKQPNLFYISQLDGSSFRVKLLINRSWSNELLYPNNQEYAKIERSLSESINRIYRDDPSFINLHLLSFNFHDTTSFYADFIINFNQKEKHLLPLLKLIITGTIADVPISIDKIFIYVLDTTKPATLSPECAPDCLLHNCSTHLCSEQCCKTQPQNATTFNTPPDEPLPKFQNENAIFENNTNLQPTATVWPFNTSAIHDEIISILSDMSFNDTMKSANLFNQNYSPNSQETTTYSTIPEFSGNSFAQPNTYSDSWMNNKFPSFPSPSISPSASFILDTQPSNIVKRTFVPKYVYPSSNAVYQPNPYIQGPFQYYPTQNIIHNTPQTRMQVPTETTNMKIGNKMKIWFPKL